MTHRTAKVSGFSYAHNLILSALPKISQKPLTEKTEEVLPFKFCLLNQISDLKKKFNDLVSVENYQHQT